MIIKCAMNTQGSEIMETGLKLGPIVHGPKGPTRKILLSQLVDILLKPFSKHIKSFICDSLDFLIKCLRDADEGTKK